MRSLAGSLRCLVGGNFQLVRRLNKIAARNKIMNSESNIYRAFTSEQKQMHIDREEGRRVPGNVPYVVDNLWEWVRVKNCNEYPSRRSAVFASPTPKEAEATQPGSSVWIYRVVLPSEWKVAQLTGYADAKLHSDVRRLVSMVKGDLKREWFSRKLSERGDEAMLFCPCLDAEEIDSIIKKSKTLNENKLHDAVSFWRNLNFFNPCTEILSTSGEIFFEAPKNGYDLVGPVN
jgi:hypothetical protein